jgi:hypothetical protein
MAVHQVGLLAHTWLLQDGRKALQGRKQAGKAGGGGEMAHMAEMMQC